METITHSLPARNAVAPGAKVHFCTPYAPSLKHNEKAPEESIPHPFNCGEDKHLSLDATMMTRALRIERISLGRRVGEKEERKIFSSSGQYAVVDCD